MNSMLATSQGRPRSLGETGPAVDAFAYQRLPGRPSVSLDSGKCYQCDARLFQVAVGSSASLVFCPRGDFFVASGVYKSLLPVALPSLRFQCCCGSRCLLPSLTDGETIVFSCQSLNARVHLDANVVTAVSVRPGGGFEGISQCPAIHFPAPGELTKSEIKAIHAAVVQQGQKGGLRTPGARGTLLPTPHTSSSSHDSDGAGGRGADRENAGVRESASPRQFGSDGRMGFYESRFLVFGAIAHLSKHGTALFWTPSDDGTDIVSSTEAEFGMAQSRSIISHTGLSPGSVHAVLARSRRSGNVVSSVKVSAGDGTRSARGHRLTSKGRHWLRTARKSGRFRTLRPERLSESNPFSQEVSQNGKSESLQESE